MDIGKHCSKPGCNQQDFLPFECDCCHGVFCLEHRTYEDHECVHAGAKDSRAITCPLCRGTIPLTGNMDVNIVWENHARNDCKPEKYQENKKAKVRCAAETCREILTASNSVVCSTCHKKVCLRHRFETDHQCTRRAPSSRLLSTKSTLPIQERLNSVGSSVSSSMSRLVKSAKTAMPSTNVTASSESCPSCQEKFRYASQLIAHVNKAHPDSSRSRPAPAPTPAPAPRQAAVASTQVETCPVCRATFTDVAQLIEHAEKAHQDAQNKGECSTM
ncbi:hypothetical protein THRCLA_09176 [Thraustotheca clavata]|uniref:AN1-type domain-containing protein n=1 Tax=Thraustotheca clavata TaxID=74557 RepID=A0A1V9YYI5_9STRA|nr:hypothetical protein THRCLA_09176 [Thraustotheca clavata]